MLVGSKYGVVVGWTLHVHEQDCESATQNQHLYTGRYDFCNCLWGILKYSSIYICCQFHFAVIAEIDSKRFKNVTPTFLFLLKCKQKAIIDISKKRKTHYWGCFAKKKLVLT